MKHFSHYLKNEQATQAIGQHLASLLTPPFFIAFIGALGTGKTTLIRALLRQAGIVGPIKSPTYSLIEVYEINQHPFVHVDLYRLSDPEELELMGWRDYFSDDAIWFIEWPEKAPDFLPMIDLSCHLTFDKTGRSIEIRANSEKGVKILTKLKELLGVI